MTGRWFGLPTRHRAYKWVALLAGVVAVARCGRTWACTTTRRTSWRISRGRWGCTRRGRNIYMVEHPTLQRLVVGGALRAAGVEYPAARGLVEVQARPDANVAGAEILFHGKRGTGGAGGGAAGEFGVSRGVAAVRVPDGAVPGEPAGGDAGDACSLVLMRRCWGTRGW